jgi:hypothetical protein
MLSCACRQSVSRRYSFPLRTGHKAAYLCTETTMYRYVESLDAPKKWFKSNVDSIMETYGPIHQIQKEDLFLVIGTLSAPDYALFVSHKHPDGQVFHLYLSSAVAHTETRRTSTYFHRPRQGNRGERSRPTLDLNSLAHTTMNLSSATHFLRAKFRPTAQAMSGTLF